MSRLSCVQNCLCPDYRAFKIAYVQTIVRSKLHMSRLSCVQNCICPDYRAFIFFPDRVILNARRHLVRSFRSGHIDFRSETSTWEVLIKIISSLGSEKRTGGSPCILLNLLKNASLNGQKSIPCGEYREF